MDLPAQSLQQTRLSGVSKQLFGVFTVLAVAVALAISAISSAHADTNITVSNTADWNAAVAAANTGETVHVTLEANVSTGAFLLEAGTLNVDLTTYRMTVKSTDPAVPAIEVRSGASLYLSGDGEFFVQGSHGDPGISGDDGDHGADGQDGSPGDPTDIDGQNGFPGEPGEDGGPGGPGGDGGVALLNGGTVGISGNAFVRFVGGDGGRGGDGGDGGRGGTGGTGGEGYPGNNTSTGGAGGDGGPGGNGGDGGSGGNGAAGYVGLPGHTLLFPFNEDIDPNFTFTPGLAGTDGFPGFGGPRGFRGNGGWGGDGNQGPHGNEGSSGEPGGWDVSGEWGEFFYDDMGDLAFFVTADEFAFFGSGIWITTCGITVDQMTSAFDAIDEDLLNREDLIFVGWFPIPFPGAFDGTGLDEIKNTFNGLELTADDAVPGTAEICSFPGYEPGMFYIWKPIWEPFGGAGDDGDDGGVDDGGVDEVDGAADGSGDADGGADGNADEGAADGDFSDGDEGNADQDAADGGVDSSINGASNEELADSGIGESPTPLLIGASLAIILGAASLLAVRTRTQQ